MRRVGGFLGRWRAPVGVDGAGAGAGCALAASGSSAHRPPGAVPRSRRNGLIIARSLPAALPPLPCPCPSAQLHPRANSAVAGPQLHRTTRKPPAGQRRDSRPHHASRAPPASRSRRAPPPPRPESRQPAAQPVSARRPRARASPGDPTGWGPVFGLRLMTSGAINREAAEDATTRASDDQTQAPRRDGCFWRAIFEKRVATGDGRAKRRLPPTLRDPARQIGVAGVLLASETRNARRGVLRLLTLLRLASVSAPLPSAEATRCARRCPPASDRSRRQLRRADKQPARFSMRDASSEQVGLTSLPDSGNMSFGAHAISPFASKLSLTKNLQTQPCATALSSGFSYATPLGALHSVIVASISAAARQSNPHAARRITQKQRTRRSSSPRKETLPELGVAKKNHNRQIRVSPMSPTPTVVCH